MGNPLLGEIDLVGFNFAPVGWSMCDGALLAINTHQALYSLLGTTYGGDGRTTFKLPDYRGRLPIGSGDGPGLSNYSRGQETGNYQEQLTTANLPPHNHAFIPNSSAKLETGSGKASSGVAFFAGSKVATPSTSKISGFTASLSNTGNGQAFNIMPPYQTVAFVIAMTGMFPSRN